MTGEMNTLRNKRIDLLKGIQGIKTNKYITITQHKHYNVFVINTAMAVTEFQMYVFCSGLS